MTIIYTAYEGRFCGDDVDGCRDLACFPGVECTDNPAPDEGATCGSCPEGYFQIGGKCLGKTHAADIDKEMEDNATIMIILFVRL